MKENGFSLIEVLIVIIILSVVVVIMLSALDPMEQIAKARDVARLREGGDLLKAYGRYAQSFKCLPWDPGAPDCTGVDNSRLDNAVFPDFSETGVDYDLIRQNILKESFANKRSIKNNEFLVSVNDERRVAVCYEPESKKNRQGTFLPLMDRLNATPIPGNKCLSIEGYPDDSCFICLGI